MTQQPSDWLEPAQQMFPAKLPVSSSIRQPVACDGLLHSSDQPASPLRLPMRGRQGFIERFNKVYQSLGIRLSMNQSTPTAASLREKKCVPCEGGVPVIAPEQAAEILASLPGWSLDPSGTSIFRKLNSGDFVTAVKWISQIAEVAEAEQHHPDLHLTGYRHLKVVLTTHAIGGLSENDFIVAAKLDSLLEE